MRRTQYIRQDSQIFVPDDHGQDLIFGPWQSTQPSDMTPTCAHAFGGYGKASS